MSYDNFWSSTLSTQPIPIKSNTLWYVVIGIIGVLLIVSVLLPTLILEKKKSGPFNYTRPQPAGTTKITGNSTPLTAAQQTAYRTAIANALQSQSS